MAFVKEIDQNTVDSHQTSPAYVLTFVRWSNRDTYNYKNESTQETRKPLVVETRNPLVVYNDAISVTVSNNKQSLTPTTNIILKGGDINYSTAIHPGDFVFVNMLNWEEDAKKVRDKAAGGEEPINKADDGFKGLFKIQTVMKDLSVNPSTGHKNLSYIITAAGFTEFNNVINYNPAITSAFREAGTALYQFQIGNEFANLLKSNYKVQDMMRILYKILLGQSLKKDKIKEVQNYGNTHFIIPGTVGKLLGINEAKYAVDIYNFITGIWKPSGTTNSSLYKAFNPKIKPVNSNSNFYDTGIDIEGVKEIRMEDWSKKTSWSILKGYSNQVMNEMYTTFRLSPDGDRVMPTVITRQKPFNNYHFRPASGYEVSNFLDLPRWKISANLLKKIVVGKNDAARFNFVQVFTQTIPGIDQNSQALQIASRNFKYDEEDIKRNGLRPYITSAPFNFITQKDFKEKAKPWSEIVSDWVIDGHLKETGTMVFVGIQDAVSVGDNLEFDNIVYHIESVIHNMAITPYSKKRFTTTFTLSYGIDKRSGRSGPIYADMEHTDSHTDNIEDGDFEQIKPGISDTQDIVGRQNGEEVNETRQKSFTPTELRKTRKD